MQSPHLTAGTGALQAGASAMQDDIDLTEVDEILSQHSNHKSDQTQRSQRDPTTISSGKTAASQLRRHSMTAERLHEQHDLASAGPDAGFASSSVIDLSAVSEPESGQTSVHRRPTAYSADQNTSTVPQHLQQHDSVTDSNR